MNDIADWYLNYLVDFNGGFLMNEVLFVIDFGFAWGIIGYYLIKFFSLWKLYFDWVRVMKKISFVVGFKEYTLVMKLYIYIFLWLIYGRFDEKINNNKQ
jgi:hypothetical protein